MPLTWRLAPRRIFFLEPENAETRLSIAMTLVLAINVFQVVLTDNTPETGYLSLLAIYTLLNTVLLCLHTHRIQAHD